MRTKHHHHHLSSFLLLFLFLFHHHSEAQQPPSPPPNTTGYTCTANNNNHSTTSATYPCQTYAFFTAMSPDFLDLASIGDLFSVSRLMISNPSSISSPTTPLLPHQPLFIPLTCSCNPITNGSTTTSLSFANLTYTIKKDDTFYYLSTHIFQNLTTYQSVQFVNPNLIPTLLKIGVSVVFPIFCKCPNTTQLQNQENYLISYVFQPSDTIPSIAARFGSTTQSIVDINGGEIQPFETVFVSVPRLPTLAQPSVFASSSEKNEQKVHVIGLEIGLGVCGVLLVLVGGLWAYREAFVKKRRAMEREEKRSRREKGLVKEVKVSLMANVSDCLDKYRVYEIEELREATDGFDQRWMIHRSVYKGCIDGGVYAIKKMKWNACEELKILQKVNHGNLVKLEGFCIDPEDANCYLVYEYFENGSLHSWLHEHNEKLNWKTRLRIAIDVANGLQYIHEHTRPRVVHKDIKSTNILLDANKRAKIANFGLAKSGCNAITMHIVGTRGYIAPEYLADGLVSTKMDVFSFGVVLLELVSGRKAKDEKGNLLWMSVKGVLDGNENRKEKNLKGWMDGFLLNEVSCSMESVMNVMVVAIACLHRDPSKRPSMVDIVYALCKSDDLFLDISEDGLSPRQVNGR
ncbi:unnamed protein product [Camellia sinensis]